MTDYRYVIVGLGNVAWHLERMLLLTGISPTLMHSEWNHNSFTSHSLDAVDQSNTIVFLTVRDDSIAAIACRFHKAFLVHCSGSKSLNVLPENRGAVLWPVQTFTQGVEMNYDLTPLILECDCLELRHELFSRFSAVSNKLITMDSLRRKQVHLAAVIAQNFSNRMVAEAEKVLLDSGVDYSILLPLLSESLRKLHSVHPEEAQTGPAVRGDFEVLNSHLKSCASDPGLMELYQLISSRINPSFKHE